jgi:hypothetical protein
LPFSVAEKHDAMMRKKREVNTLRKIRLTKVILLSLAIVTLQVLSAHATADFTFSANPNRVNPIAGLPVYTTITMNSTGGFFGTINFTATAPWGYTTSYNPTSVTLSSGGSATTKLAITADPNCNQGNGSVVARGTSGSLSHFVFVALGPVRC